MSDEIEEMKQEQKQLKGKLELLEKEYMQSIRNLVEASQRSKSEDAEDAS